jgi:hypothetical protein
MMPYKANISHAHHEGIKAGNIFSINAEFGNSITYFSVA